MTRFRITALALIAGAALALAACGGGDGDSGEEVAAERSDAMLEFAQCMRDHGIDFPDPVPGEGVKITSDMGIDLDSPEFRSAQEDCRSIIEEAIPEEARPKDGEVPQELLDFAQCMRDQGIDFPDPQVDGGMVRIGPGPGGEQVDPEKFEAANEACRDEMPEGGLLGGPGPGGPDGQ